jgi:hypothetical protein
MQQELPSEEKPTTMAMEDLKYILDFYNNKDK